jgi:exosome complex component RRP41
MHVVVGKLQGRDGGDLQAIIESTFKQIIFPESSEISVQVQILANDGSLLATVCNAVSLALIDAGIEMKDGLVAVSVSLSNKCPILDLNYSEESLDLPVFTVAYLPRTGNLALTHLEGRLSADAMPDLVELGKLGCDLMHEQFDEVVRQNIA